MGVGALPGLAPVGSGGLDESLEGRLVSTGGVLTTRPKRSSGGDLTITLERDGANPVRLIADSSSRVAQASFTIGTTYQVAGVVGQRASRKDAPDGYRICLRDSADLMAGGTAASPASTVDATRVPAAPGAAVEVVTIERALGLSDVDVAVEGVVIASATLLDTSGRRIVIQDVSAAIELLLPVGEGAPPVGTRIHAEGRVGVAYGAPRLRAERVDRLAGGQLPAPLVLHGPPATAHEWRLVAITGRIDSVTKLGERWRAELAAGSVRVPIVGQPGSGIASSSLAEGRVATIVGIVRRPFPTAADRRYAILPRFAADLRLEGGSVTRQSPTGRQTGREDTGVSSGAGTSNGIPAANAGVSDVDLVDLTAAIGRTVRVGGLVADLRSDGVMLDDGTSTGRIVLRGNALDLLPLLEPDDAINAIGRVDQLEDGPAVIVGDASGLSQAGDPLPPDAARVAIAAGASIDPGALVAAGLADSPLGAGGVGIATLIALSAASLGITALRRWYLRRRLADRIAARLAGLEPPPGPSPAPRSAERGRRSID